jgi:prepilin peptidase CpaA
VWTVLEPFFILSILLQIAFFGLVISSAYTDMTRHRVYNWITIPAILIGFGLNFAVATYGRGSADFSQSLLGFAIGFGVFFTAYIFGGVGGGDVKLMAAIGALMGFPFIVSTIFWSALVGSGMALGYLIWKGRLLKGLKSSLRLMFTFRKKAETAEGGEGVAGKIKIPYGLAIALGSTWAWLLYFVIR